jgi:hypothetical protein
MATVDERTYAGGQRPHGRDSVSLAEVITIRPHRSPGLLGSLVTLARDLTPLRTQATSARSTPRPPSSPDLLPTTSLGAPDDAA